MESIPGIVVGAEILRRCLTANRSIEHPAQGPAINDAALNTKTNHATGELIDHDENPVRSQRCGFTAEQIVTPQTVLHVAEEPSARMGLPSPIPAGNEGPGYGEQHPC
jgi:hypothetical protein